MADGKLLPGHRWRVGDGAEHAFSIFRNRPSADQQVSMCGRVMATVNVKRGTAPRCFACITLVNAGA